MYRKVPVSATLFIGDPNVVINLLIGRNLI